MALPRVIQGTYAFQNREVRYRTKCPHCPRLAVCKERRAPTDCPVEDVGWVRFLVDGVGKVYESGVIELKKVDRWVWDYLESEPPPDVAMGMEQMRMKI